MNRIIALAATAVITVSPLALAATTTQASAAPNAAKVAAKAGAYSVTAKANKKVAIAREDLIKVTGRVSPKAAGQKVILQQRVGNKKKWTETGTAKINKGGTYKLKDKPSTPGEREYRVVKPAAGGIAKGTSKSVSVTVYRWDRLAYRSSGPRTNLTSTSAVIGTDYYSASLVTDVAGTAASIEYTLGRKCTQLKSSYALTDASATGSTGAISVTTDGTVRATHALAVGTVVADHVIDLTGVYRLKFDVTTTATPAAVAAVAEPMVLCTR